MAMDAVTRIGDAGAGLCTSVLSDERGRGGRLDALAPRRPPPPVDGSRPDGGTRRDSVTTHALRPPELEPGWVRAGALGGLGRRLRVGGPCALPRQRVLVAAAQVRRDPAPRQRHSMRSSIASRSSGPDARQPISEPGNTASHRIGCHGEYLGATKELTTTKVWDR